MSEGSFTRRCGLRRQASAAESLCSDRFRTYPSVFVHTEKECGFALGQEAKSDEVKTTPDRACAVALPVPPTNKSTNTTNTYYAYVMKMNDKGKVQSM